MVPANTTKKSLTPDPAGTHEETVRWTAKLYRHYGIEGKTNLLSNEYGFRYRLTYLRNPDFDEGTEGWTVAQAEPGSVNTGTMQGFGKLEGRVRGSSRGDNFVRMKRSARKPNRVVQQLKGLEPGRLYSLKMFTADYHTFQSGTVSKQKHAVEIRIDNAEIIPDRAFQAVIQSRWGQEVPPFSRERQPWLNYYWRLFRETGTTADLTISDWASAEEPSGPIGQELMFNFIEVQPYFNEPGFHI